MSHGNHPRGAKRAEIREKSAGPLGVAVADVPGASSHLFYKLCDMGHIFTTKKGQGMTPKRYFDSQERADDYYANLKVPPKMPKPKSSKAAKLESTTPVVFKTEKRSPGGPARMPGEPIITANTRITIAPPPRDRWDLARSQQ